MKATKSDFDRYCALCRGKIPAGEPHLRDPQTGLRTHRTMSQCEQAKLASAASAPKSKP